MQPLPTTSSLLDVGHSRKAKKPGRIRPGFPFVTRGLRTPDPPVRNPRSRQVMEENESAFRNPSDRPRARINAPERVRWQSLTPVLTEDSVSGGNHDKEPTDPPVPAREGVREEERCQITRASRCWSGKPAACSREGRIFCCQSPAPLGGGLVEPLRVPLRGLLALEACASAAATTCCCTGSCDCRRSMGAVRTFYFCRTRPLVGHGACQSGRSALPQIDF